MTSTIFSRVFQARRTVSRRFHDQLPAQQIEAFRRSGAPKLVITLSGHLYEVTSMRESEDGSYWSVEGVEVEEKTTITGRKYLKPKQFPAG